MKLNFLDKCSTIATLSTCILNTNHSWDKSEVEIQLTDNFGIKASYYYSVYDSVDATRPLDVQLFEVNFFRNGQLLDCASFMTCGKAYGCGSLCDENKELNFKLEWLKTVKPDIIERVRFMTNRMNLSNEEITAIEQKANELENIVNEMKQNIGRGK